MYSISDSAFFLTCPQHKLKNIPSEFPIRRIFDIRSSYWYCTNTCALQKFSGNGDFGVALT